ncbi:hypothetical protein CTAYLR_007525 [Chrysophaeum taylorii]|uniref:Uncharacterized protein n=1 Tax=Chrysophaeum taylorii TaxID=2483200 RepID=A0AAD7U6J7_9STRA|nr:hypothetical protein CTAYLR_007525 [Chrysophaeum taylorii]
MRLFLCAVVAATAFVQQSPLSGFKRSRAYGLRLMAESPEAMLEKAAQLRAEIAAETPATEAPKTMSDEEAKAKISAALRRATKARDKEQLKIALAAAEKAGFTASDEDVKGAVVAFNQLSELSDNMRQRLIAEARSQGGDPSVNWNPGFAYAGVFGVMAVLVVLGGKGIFY